MAGGVIKVSKEWSFEWLKFSKESEWSFEWLKVSKEWSFEWLKVSGALSGHVFYFILFQN